MAVSRMKRKTTRIIAALLVGLTVVSWVILRTVLAEIAGPGALIGLVSSVAVVPVGAIAVWIGYRHYLRRSRDSDKSDCSNGRRPTDP
jgi:hypothetical protein